MYFCEDFRESYAFLKHVFYRLSRIAHISVCKFFGGKLLSQCVQSHVRLLPIDFTFDMIIKIKKL